MRQFIPPVIVVLGGIGVNRLLGSAVHREVCLLVADQIQFANLHRAVHRLLEYPSLDPRALPGDLTRHADVD